MYPDPERFLPERYLQHEGKEGQVDPALVGAFGFGRRYIYISSTAVRTFATNCARICPGRYLAVESVWLAMAYILTLYEVSAAKDENGREIKLKKVDSDEMQVSMYVLYLYSVHLRSSHFLMCQTPKAVQDTIHSTVKGFGKPR